MRFYLVKSNEFCILYIINKGLQPCLIILFNHLKLRIMKKIFLTADNGTDVLFINEAFAKQEAEARNCKLQTKEVSEKEFKKLLKEKTFFDTAEYLESLNDNKIKPIAGSKEVTDLKKELSELTKENEALKKNVLSISIEEAGKLYARKALLLDYYRTFKGKRTQLDNLQVEDMGTFDDSDTVKFGFFNTSSYRDEKMLSIANVDIVRDMKDYVLKLIDSKIIEIESELTVLM